MRFTPERFSGAEGPEGNRREAPEQPHEFTADWVLRTLRSKSGDRTIDYIGSSTSDFQAEPLIEDEHGKPKVFSDWEYEIVRKQEGGRTGIPDADLRDLPRFFDKKSEYVARSRAVGENMYRLSLDFARLCPAEGVFDEAMMAKYVEALALVKARGGTPFLTLHHFTMPKYLVETDAQGDITAGGWEHPDVSRHFRFYVDNVVRFLANDDKVRGVLANAQLDRRSQDRFLSEGLANYFMSINEPMTTLQNGYLWGAFLPYKTAANPAGRYFDLKKVLGHMVEAHDIAYGEVKHGLRRQQDEPQVGVGYNWNYFDRFLGIYAAHKGDRYVTSRFERDGSHSDFLGLQYYFRMTLPLLPHERRARDYGDQPTFGDVYPPGIYEMLKDMHEQYPTKQIFVTEFGFSDAADLRRPYWILETVRYILEAKKAGVPVKGMLLWSLVNNFEWQLGMSQKFGLFDEADLAKSSLDVGPGIKSWEVWKAVTKAVTNPSEGSLAELQQYYEWAKDQYRAAGGKY
ncbi:MAG TPA: family 1 glycosylhydrolase [Candidatus Paceibacterota bacterium]|nr:family 1 glycosylhydrolase [Candidatus Paceibacterota bacterium]